MEMLIDAPSFSKEFPWELSDSQGRVHRFWRDDDAFWGKINRREVSFRAGCRLEFELSIFERADSEGEFLPIISRVSQLITPADESAGATHPLPPNLAGGKCE